MFFDGTAGITYYIFLTHNAEIMLVNRGVTREGLLGYVPWVPRAMPASHFHLVKLFSYRASPKLRKIEI